ncbi:MAG: hypothetical protein F6K28_29405 [Microcoleus sp. SIO2G3]|nr:hypothetical protein [Microcoleus sp. SIO2G3]
MSRTVAQFQSLGNTLPLLLLPDPQQTASPNQAPRLALTCHAIAQARQWLII